MSQIRNYPIQCPQCENVQDADLYDAINVSEQPDLRDDLMTNRLNQITCSQCGFEFRVDKALLYNDPDNRVMIYCMESSDSHYKETGLQAFQEAVRTMSEALPDDVLAPDIHLVMHRVELIERIFLIEADLDERIIEYIKYTIYSQNVSKMPPEKKRLLFDAEDSSDEKLVFVVQDMESQKLESMLEYSREAYDTLCEVFDEDDKTANLLELFPGPYVSAQAQLLAAAATG